MRQSVQRSHPSSVKAVHGVYLGHVAQVTQRLRGVCKQPLDTVQQFHPEHAQHLRLPLASEHRVERRTRELGHSARWVVHGTPPRCDQLGHAAAEGFALQLGHQLRVHLLCARPHAAVVVQPKAAVLEHPMRECLLHTHIHKRARAHTHTHTRHTVPRKPPPKAVAAAHSTYQKHCRITAINEDEQLLEGLELSRRILLAQLLEAYFQVTARTSRRTPEWYCQVYHHTTTPATPATYASAPV